MTPATDLVSVVIPVWRPSESHWRECLACVLAQEHRPMEVVVTDNDPHSGVAKRIIDELGAQDVVYLPNPTKKGIFRNLNFAIEQCSGQYIQLFCQDDRMLPGFLSAQVTGLQLHADAAFLYGQCHTIDGDGRQVEACQYEQPGRPYLYFSSENTRACLYKYGCLPGNLSAVMLRRELLEANGLFDENLQYASDFLYWATATRHGGMAISTRPLFELRRHRQQASRVLGAAPWLTETAPVYQQLYQQLPTKLRTLPTRLYANEHFGQHAFLALLQQALHQRNFSLLKKLHLLNRPPFSLLAIVPLVFLSLRNRIAWFRLKEVELFPREYMNEQDVES